MPTNAMVTIEKIPKKSVSNVEVPLIERNPMKQ